MAAGSDGPEGNTSQQHGLDFENLVKASHKFPGACNADRSGVATVDIEGRFDPLFGLNTAVKAIGGDSIPLADAPRFYGIDRPWRLMPGVWVQRDPECKLFTRIHEMIIPIGVMTRLRGEVTAEEMLAHHSDIASFAHGPEAAAAARVRKAEIKRMLAGRHGILRLDFKIDRHGQRRLQVSVSLKQLVGILRNEPDYVKGRHRQPLHVVHDRRFCQYELPIPILSPGRRIVSVAQEETTTGTALFEHLPVARSIMVDDAPKPLRRAAPRRLDHRRPTPPAEDGRQRGLFGI